MKISVIIPNYNGSEVLKKNLPIVIDSISSSNYKSEIVISDDASTDDSISVINKFIEKYKASKVNIKVVIADKNKGFSSNVNKGAGAASGDILILLNTDVSPSKNFLAPLIKHFDDEKVFAVGCMDESVEGGEVVLRGRGKGFWKKGFLNHSAADVKEGTTTLWVSGGSGAFRKSIWDKLGGMDTIYDPFYWEDIDLSYRALKSGYKTIFENKSIVRHEHEKGVIKSKFKSNDVKKTVYRNQFIFAWKNSDLGTLINGLIWLPIHLLNALISGDFPLIAGFFRATMRIPRIINSRIKSKKFFVKSDIEVVSL